MPSTVTTSIHPRSTINETLLAHPGSVAVFNALGVDSCCGGAATLAAAARDAGIDERMLVAALQGAASAGCEARR